MFVRGGGKSNYIIIRQSSEIFYTVFDEDAIIFNYLFGYKVIDGNRVGFPKSAYHKVINILEEKKISYMITCSNQTDEYYFNNNNYNKVLNQALAHYDITNKVNSLIDKIYKLDNIKLNNLLKLIEEYLNEQ